MRSGLEKSIGGRKVGPGGIKEMCFHCAAVIKMYGKRPVSWRRRILPVKKRNSALYTAFPHLRGIAVSTFRREKSTPPFSFQDLLISPNSLNDAAHLVSQKCKKYKIKTPHLPVHPLEEPVRRRDALLVHAGAPVSVGRSPLAA